ncbi:MAG: hypothetical protein HRT70_08750 [Flavobacteriaceae bacterium]|nr:hypothetical protein [Flavobacteriaceae bacterium]
MILEDEKKTHIDLWKESGLSKRAYSIEAKLGYKTFSNWVKKYDPTFVAKLKKPQKTPAPFIPIEISNPIDLFSAEPTNIEISYPNGVRMSCPVSMDLSQLKSLIKLY